MGNLEEKTVFKSRGTNYLEQFHSHGHLNAAYMWSFIWWLHLTGLFLDSSFIEEIKKSDC